MLGAWRIHGMLRKEIKLQLYVIGPVTGLPDRNVNEFGYARVQLVRAGYEVAIPHDVIPRECEWAEAMRTSVMKMLACDGARQTKNSHKGGHK